MDCMHQNPKGLTEYREQVVVFHKGCIGHIARIITYIDIKKGKTPKPISLLTNDVDMPIETIVAIYRVLMYYLNLEKFLNQPDADLKIMLAEASETPPENLENC